VEEQDKIDFYYTDLATGDVLKNKKELERIHKLHIPPAYKNVMISKEENAKVLAYGYDSKGRKQMIYHPSFIEKQQKQKYERLYEVLTCVPALLKKLKLDSKRPEYDKACICALATTLIILCNFRVGSKKYEKENGSTGVTTLQCRHVQLVKVPRAPYLCARFCFIGKRGVENVGICKSKSFCMYVANQKEKKTDNDYLFTYGGANKEGNIHLHADDVNMYLKEVVPGMNLTSKDLRTWKANATFAKTVTDGIPAKKAIKIVAEEMHHTPAVCKQSYLDPSLVVVKDL